MRLKRLAISNCSRIKDIDIEVRDNLVLIGPNGSGKTTVLLCLNMLLEMDAQRLYGTITEDFVRDSSQPCSVEAVFEHLTTRELAVFPDVVDPSSSNELSVKLDISVADDEVDIVRYIPNCGTRNPLSKAQRDAFGWTLLQAQASSQESGQGEKSILDEDLLSDLRHQIKESGGTRLVHEYSDRTRTLFAMTVYDLLNQGVNILAIDEPEAHLHPASQRSLAKMLKSGTSQKVLVTHSPTIAGSFRPDEIVVIRSDGAAVQPERGFLSGDAGMLARWWIGSQLEPLTAGTVIAVEGASDRIIVNKVASSLGFDLDRNDVVVIETDGCGDMKVVESIFGNDGFDIPLFVLVDEDAREKTAKRFGADPDDPADMAKHGVFISQNDLEDEYVRAIGPGRLWARMQAVNAFSKTEFAQCPLGPDGNPTESDLAEFIRAKRRGRKMPSALVAADLIDSSIAPRVKSAASILRAALA